MSKFRTIKNALIGGEISPTALGRTDLPVYQFSCETLLNMIPMLSGGAYRRPGTLYEKSVADAKPARMLPFVRSLREPYAVILSDGDVEIRQVTTGAYSDANVTGALASSTTVRDRMEIQHVQSADVMYLVQANMKPKRILRTDLATFSVVDFDTDSSGTTLTGTAFREAWPYLQSRTDVALTIDTAKVGTGRTLSATKGGNPYAFFATTHVGAVFKIVHGSTYGCVKVTAVATDKKSATVDVIVELGATSGSDGFYESAWSDHRGWPRAIAIYKDRIVYGGTLNNPDTLWFTKRFYYDVLSVVSGAPSSDDPFDRALASTQLNTIQWLVAGETLAIGTSADEWILSPVSDGKIGVDTTSLGHLLSKTSNYGSAYKQAFRAGNSIYFVASNGCEVKELTFNDTEQGYVADPLSVLYDEHPKRNVNNLPAAYAYDIGAVMYFTEREFASFVWDKSRSTIWCCDVAGNLFGCVRDRKLGVLSWHRHELGGSGKVVSLCMVPNITNNTVGREDLWLCVERTVNGSTVYHVERMTGGNVDEDDVYTAPLIRSGVDRNFTDCSMNLSNAYPVPETYPVELVMNHLQGESVVLTAASTKGIFALPARTVELLSNATDYGVTLTETLPNYDNELYFFSVGYNFNSVIVPVRFDAGSQIGTAQGARKRIHDISVRFYKTIGCKYGPDENHLTRIIFRESSTPLNKSADLFTGDKKMSFASGYDRDGYIYLLQDQPLPFTVCAVMAEGVTYD